VRMGVAVLVVLNEMDIVPMVFVSMPLTDDRPERDLLDAWDKSAGLEAVESRCAHSFQGMPTAGCRLLEVAHLDGHREGWVCGGKVLVAGEAYQEAVVRGEYAPDELGRWKLVP